MPEIRQGWVEDGVGYVPLTQGKIAKVDPEDLELVCTLNWYTSNWRNLSYATNRSEKGGKKTTTKMHRLVLRAEDPNMKVDHINRDTLDNRKSNLRVCSHEENIRNGNIRSSNKTGYKGVSFESFTQKYRAGITVHYKHICLGRYDTPEEASQAYLEASKRLHGEFASSGVASAL